MDKLCFLISMESSDYYFNQVKFLLYSFRKYAGTLKDSFFYICVNDGGLDQNKIDFLEKNFSPLEVVQKKYQGLSHGFARRYNLFQHFDKFSEFDSFVYLDCDIMIGTDIGPILQLNDKASFKGIPSGIIESKILTNYDDVLETKFGFSKSDIKKIKEKWEFLKSKEIWNRQCPSTTPHFNGGLWILDKSAFIAIKNHIQFYLRKCYKLSSGRRPTLTQLWNFEQTALSIFVMKEIENYSLLNFSWKGPEIYHNFKGVYGELHYTNPMHPDIKSKYPNYDSEMNYCFIAKIITEFYEECGGI